MVKIVIIRRDKACRPQDWIFISISNWPSQTLVVVFAKTEEQPIQDRDHKPEPAKQVCCLVSWRQLVTKPSTKGGERIEQGQNVGQRDALAIYGEQWVDGTELSIKPHYPNVINYWDLVNKYLLMIK